MAAHPTNLGPIIVPPTPRRSANMTLEEYMQAVDVWTKQVEQAFRQIERYLTTTKSQLVPSGGTTGQKLTKNSNADFDDGWA